MGQVGNLRPIYNPPQPESLPHERRSPGLSPAIRQSLAHTESCGTLIYVDSRNITFTLPVDLIRQAKVYAAEHDTTINSLVREPLQESLACEGRQRAAADR